MPLIYRLAEWDRLRSSHWILATVVVLALVVGILYYVGVVGWVIQVLSSAVRGAVRWGFLVWERLFAWAMWPQFLVIVVGLLAVGVARAEAWPALAIIM